MTSLYLPATLADWMHLGKPTRPAMTVLQLPLRYGWLDPSSAKLPPEISAVVTFVGGQAGWALSRPALRPGHSYLVYHLKSHGNLGHIGPGHQKSHGQPVTFRHQVDGAAFALPAIGDIFTPFLPGTKLPSRNACLQSNLAWASRVLRNFNRMPSQTPWSCHCWSRRWQVDRLPYFGGRSLQRAPERKIQRMPVRVRRSSARGLPLLLGFGSSGAISSHCSSCSSPSVIQTSHLET